jgi:heat shock protein HslJ
LLKNVLICLGITCAFMVVSSTLALDKTSPQGIENRRWSIAKYRGDGTQKSDEQGLIDAAKTAEITFAMGRIHGSPTCGALVGTYRLSGVELTIQADFILNGFCPPEELAQNQLVLTAFKGDLRIEQKDDHILLRDTSGKARVLLVPY